MKAAVYYENGGPEVLKYEELPDPPLQPKGVVIDVKAVSIEGGDVLNRAQGPLATTPHVVGYQCGGVISEVGAEVEGWKPGDRVVTSMGFGSHAAKASVPSRALWRVPDGADMNVISAVPIAFGTADYCLFEFGKLQPGETVLIQGGAGGVGLAAIQLAKRHGATTIATASSDAKLERLKEFGLDHGVNYKERDAVQAVMEITGGKGANLVVDPVGTTLPDSMKCMAYRGRTVFVGNMGRASTKVDVMPLLVKNQSLIGVLLGAEMGVESTRAMIQRHIDDVAAGKLKMVVDRTFPLSEAAAAHAYIEGRNAFGRVLLIP
jgi:NADPH2:quinone reductase